MLILPKSEHLYKSTQIQIILGKSPTTENSGNCIKSNILLNILIISQQVKTFDKICSVAHHINYNNTISNFFQPV
jgi:hypothetical protein